MELGSLHVKPILPRDSKNHDEDVNGNALACQMEVEEPPISYRCSSSTLVYCSLASTSLCLYTCSCSNPNLSYVVSLHPDEHDGRRTASFSNVQDHGFVVIMFHARDALLHTMQTALFSAEISRPDLPLVIEISQSEAPTFATWCRNVSFVRACSFMIQLHQDMSCTVIVVQQALAHFPRGTTSLVLRSLRRC